MKSYMPYNEWFDFNPKNWMRPYQKTSIIHLLKMAFFYHVLGLGLMYGGTFLILYVLPDYIEPSFPVSLVSAITAGPIEETLFFGIPFYLSVNTQYSFLTGIIWTAVHLFNTDTWSINSLSYGGFLFVIPHLFFSYRTWKSHRGWFAIAYHSFWNITVLGTFCAMGLRECRIYNEEKFITEILIIPISVTLIITTVLLYQRNYKKTHAKKYLIVALILFVASEIPMIIFNLETLFPRN